MDLTSHVFCGTTAHACVLQHKTCLVLQRTTCLPLQQENSLQQNPSLLLHEPIFCSTAEARLVLQQSTAAAEAMSSLSREDTATEDMCSVAGEDMSSVATEDMSSVAREDMSKYLGNC